MRQVALLLWLFLMFGCLWPSEPDPPPTTEVVFAGDGVQVVVTKQIRSDFPDSSVEYAVDVQFADGLTVQVWEARTQAGNEYTIPARLPSGDLAIAGDGMLCVVKNRTRTCLRLWRSQQATAEMTESLRWRVNDMPRPGHWVQCTNDDVYAVLHLAAQEPADALRAIESWEDSCWDRKGALTSRVRGVRARLRGDRAEILELRDALVGARGNVVRGLSEACVSELEGPIRAELDRAEMAAAPNEQSPGAIGANQLFRQTVERNLVACARQRGVD